MIRAIIFDLDGTLLYSLPDIHKALNVALKRHGLKSVTQTETKLALGHGVRSLIDTIARVASNITKDYIKNTYETYYHQHTTTYSYPYEGIISLLKMLSLKQIRLGVASNKSQDLVSIICEYFFKDYIDVCRGELVGKPKKPDPDMVLDVIKKLDVLPSEVVYVGDSEPDIDVAKTIGLNHIAVSYGYRDRQLLLNKKPQMIADSVHELQVQLERIIDGSD